MLRKDMGVRNRCGWANENEPTEPVVKAAMEKFLSEMP